MLAAELSLGVPWWIVGGTLLLLAGYVRRHGYWVGK